MNGIKNVFFLICLLVISSCSYSCDVQINSNKILGKPLKIDNDSYIYFYKSGIDAAKPDFFGDYGDEYEINVMNFSCKDNREYDVDKYGYMAVSGEIKTVFYSDADDDGKKEVFVIAAWPVNTDPLEGNVGEYYEVHVYSSHGNKLELNDSIQKYFSFGIDKMKNGKLIKYPFKTAADVRKELKSTKYKKWLSSRK
jgi:hypothetical protein